MQNSITFRKQSPTRRQFLAGCSTLTLAAAASPTMALGLSFPRQTASLDSIGFAHFATQLGTVFRVWPNPQQALGMILVEAQPLPLNLPEARWAPDAQNEKFSLIFQGPEEFPLEQDTYLFEHSGLGRFPMFIVPVATRSGRDAFYEAIFNRPFTGRSQRNR